MSEQNAGFQSPGVEFTRGRGHQSGVQRETSESPSSDTSRTDRHSSGREVNGVSLSPKSTNPLTRNADVELGELVLGSAVRSSAHSNTVPQATSYMLQPQSDITEGPSSMPQEPNFWSGAPSIHFQQQFLW
ncbi:hypothetical protein BBP40_010558 [Aspergillus hancockii]|nr:hypothetical protein BBP40_010558 [Aspergillus hancockii]